MALVLGRLHLEILAGPGLEPDDVAVVAAAIAGAAAAVAARVAAGAAAGIAPAAVAAEVAPHAGNRLHDAAAGKRRGRHLDGGLHGGRLNDDYMTADGRQQLGAGRGWGV